MSDGETQSGSEITYTHQLCMYYGITVAATESEIFREILAQSNDYRKLLTEIVDVDGAEVIQSQNSDEEEFLTTLYVRVRGLEMESQAHTERISSELHVDIDYLVRRKEQFAGAIEYLDELFKYLSKEFKKNKVYASKYNIGWFVIEGVWDESGETSEESSESGETEGEDGEGEVGEENTDEDKSQ